RRRCQALPVARAARSGASVHASLFLSPIRTIANSPLPTKSCFSRAAIPARAPPRRRPLRRHADAPPARGFAGRSTAQADAKSAGARPVLARDAADSIYELGDFLVLVGDVA